MPVRVIVFVAVPPFPAIIEEETPIKLIPLFPEPLLL
ncbi:MAG: hypothetical protein FD130_19 [Halothiobacillaceae bacterium]|nr:MAG: hypothetical protein FD130_19 [Halothiobacillaceae bacterium]